MRVPTKVFANCGTFFNKNATSDQEYVAKDIEFKRNFVGTRWENEKVKRISADGQSFQSNEKIEVTDYVLPQDIQCTNLQSPSKN